MFKAVLALAIVGAIGWLGYDNWVDEDPQLPAPVTVNVETPQPFGGEPPPGDKIYIP